MPKIIGIDLGTTNSVAAIVEALFLRIKKIKNLRGFLKIINYIFMKAKKWNLSSFQFFSSSDFLPTLPNSSFIEYNLKNPFKLISFKHCNFN